jgi:hypothetical protein
MIKNFSVPPALFDIYINMLKLEELDESEKKLYSVARNGAF